MELTAAELARLILRLSPYLGRLPWRLELELIGIQAQVVPGGVGGRGRPGRLRISELTAPLSSRSAVGWLWRPATRT